MAKGRQKVGFVRAYLQLPVTVFRQLVDSDVQMLSGSLAYTTVISLVPLLAVSLSVFSAYGGMASLLSKIEPFILQNLVDASGAEISKAIRKSLDRVHNGTLGATGAFFLFLASTKLFHDMEKAVHKVWQIESSRWFVQKLVIYWTTMFLSPVLLAVALGILTSKDLGIGVLSKGTVIACIEFIALFTVYKFVPSCKVRWSSAIFSAVLATAGIRLTQLFYAQITKSMLSYNKIYGSLASIPIFLLWVLVLWYVTLTGVAICAALDKSMQGTPSKKQIAKPPAA